MPPGLTARRPLLDQSPTNVVPLTATTPELAFPPPLQFKTDPEALVKVPPLVTLTKMAGPVWFSVVLLNVVAPLSTVPPVRANVPAPRRKPPLTVAPLKVNVTPLGTSTLP